MGWTAITGTLSLPAICLYIAGIFWTLGYDTIYAHQDKEDDELIGIKSTALKLGKDSTKWVALFYILAILFIDFALMANKPHVLNILLLALPALHMGWQIRSWNMDDPANCLQRFKSNEYIGWLVLLVLSV